MKAVKQESPNVLDRLEKLPETQLKIFNEVSMGEEFLKRL